MISVNYDSYVAFTLLYIALTLLYMICVDLIFRYCKELQ